MESKARHTEPCFFLKMRLHLTASATYSLSCAESNRIGSERAWIRFACISDVKKTRYSTNLCRRYATMLILTRSMRRPILSTNFAGGLARTALSTSSLARILLQAFLLRKNLNIAKTPRYETSCGHTMCVTLIQEQRENKE